MARSLRIELAGVFLLIFLSPGVIAMSIFDAVKTCVFSEVRAQLLMNGEPIRNTKVIRRWEWNELREDSTTTDENGYFNFPAIFEFSISQFLPIEVVIGQQLSTTVEGKEIKFWSNSKREPEKNTEYGGDLFIITCELSDEEALIKEFGARMVTMCKLTKTLTK